MRSIRTTEETTKTAKRASSMANHIEIASLPSGLEEDKLTRIYS